MGLDQPRPTGARQEIFKPPDGKDSHDAGFVPDRIAVRPAPLRPILAAQSERQKERQNERTHQTSHRVITLVTLWAIYGQGHPRTMTDSPLDCLQKVYGNILYRPVVSLTPRFSGFSMGISGPKDREPLKRFKLE